MLKKILLGLLGVVLVFVVGVAGFAMTKVSAFEESITRKYDFPLPPVTLSTDPAVLARGKHLTESLGACNTCHGENFGGGKVEDLGPLGTIVHSNITAGQGGRLTEYSDAELARLLRHGIKRDGTSLRLMPVQEIFWWPDEDRVAVISYLRSLPPVDGQPGKVHLSAMAKVLDQMDAIPLDTARRVKHEAQAPPPAPAESPEYGAQLAHICHGCHGDGLSGGPIPGTPPEFGVPLNLTPHETGLKDWTFEDFDKTLRTGVRKNGQKLGPFMPVASFKNMSETEMKALWVYLRSVPPQSFGNR